MSYAYQEITTELYQQGSKSYTYWEITTGLRQQDSKTDQALKIDGFEHWVIPEKIHTPTTEGMLESLMGGGGRGNNSGNSYGRWALNLKIPPRGLLNFIDVSITSIDKFSKTTDLLPHLF